MQESSCIVRTTGKGINLKASIHRFAMELSRQVKEEESLKKDKTIKRIIRGLFRKHPDAKLSLEFLKSYVGREVSNTVEEYELNIKRTETHILLNTGTYLTLTPDGYTLKGAK